MPLDIPRVLDRLCFRYPSLLVDELIAREERIVNRWIVMLMILIVFFFICLFAYRYAAARMLPK